MEQMQRHHVMAQGSRSRLCSKSGESGTAITSTLLISSVFSLGNGCVEHFFLDCFFAVTIF